MANFVPFVAAVVNAQQALWRNREEEENRIRRQKLEEERKKRELERINGIKKELTEGEK